jgi:hypothetical protein
MTPKTYTTEQKLELCNYINKELDHEGCEILYVIIKYFSIMEEKMAIETHPYKPKINKNSIKFDINLFPNKLVNMIDQFILLHNKKVLEEKVRENIP